MINRMVEKTSSMVWKFYTSLSRLHILPKHYLIKDVHQLINKTCGFGNKHGL
jgi:hypothetical protein